MGSFDVACSVSRITINPGMPVAYFPLELYKYAYDPRAENNTLIYPWCYYVPVSLPIFGEYYDYGYIDQIEENASTKVIEKHFGRSIKGVCGGDGQLPCPGMFVHRDIYQAMVDNQVDCWGKTKLVDGDEYGKPSRAKLGARYNALRDALIAIRDTEKQKRSAKKEDKWKFDTAMTNFRLYDLEQKFGFREFETFMKIYKPIIQRGWLKKQFADFLYFNISLGYANVHYFPAANGCQWGNHYGNRIVHQKALDILNEAIVTIEERDKE